MGLRHRCEFWGRGWRQKDGYRRSLAREAKTRCLEVSSGKIKVGCELPDSVFSVHFLQFHPAILKPDFHLSVREVDATADL